ncbi:MAG: histidine phosphatase family protein [Cytophagales bacterium]|nr:histidine phosphatase family protein [Bernardetiaceae bacterium]MDW8203518.1 histidine phosphatase family protein [Cytophagales bacterium]
MKTLYLVRHAEAAEDRYPFGRDFERPLTHQGIMKAVRVGKQLAQQGIIPQVILASSAERTRHTAELLAENLGLSQSDIQLNDELYNATPRVLLQVISQIDDAYEKVMLVGHNPAISYMAEWLTNSHDINRMANCGMAYLQLDLTNWAAAKQNCGKLVQYCSFD